MVSSFIINSKWRIPACITHKDMTILNCIYQTVIPCTPLLEDKLVWCSSVDGNKWVGPNTFCTSLFLHLLLLYLGAVFITRYQQTKILSSAVVLWLRFVIYVCFIMKLHISNSILSFCFATLVTAELIA
jgi:hypothetical protein